MMTKEELLKKYDTKGCESLLIIYKVEQGSYFQAIVLNKRLGEVYFRDGVPFQGEPSFPDEVTVLGINPNTAIVDTTDKYTYDEIIEAYKRIGHTLVPLGEADKTPLLEGCSYYELAQEIELHRDFNTLVASLSFDGMRDLFTAICDNVNKQQFLYWGMGVPKEVAMVCSEIVDHYVKYVEEA